jgi:16S rRNA (cytosine967-C5)-methyltransferase
MKRLTPFEKQAAIALEIIQRIEKSVQEGYPADNTLQSIFRAHKEYGSRDRKFFSSLTFAFFRWYGWLKELSLSQKLIAAWLLDELPPHPAIEVLKEESKFDMPVIGLQNSNVSLKEKSSFLQSISLQSQATAPEQLLPEWCGDELFYPQDANKEEHFLRLINSLQKRLPAWFRIRAYASFDDIIEKIEELNLKYKTHPFLKTAMYLENQKEPPCLASVPQELLRENAVVIQDVASQGVGMLCQPSSHQIWWDVCAGAGGKSLFLADSMNYEGKIIATDIRSGALNEFRKRMLPEDQNIIKLYQHDSKKGPPENILFDGVLIDAPCSGLGTWHRAPDARWRTNQNSIQQFSDNQYELLIKVAPYVKEGGKLIYSTCTLTAKENNQVIEKFLETRNDFHLQTQQHPLTGKVVEGPLYLWQWEGPCNGMFIAVMTRQ